jgi:hypothetical protein
VTTYAVALAASDLIVFGIMIVRLKAALIDTDLAPDAAVHVPFYYESAGQISLHRLVPLYFGS